MLSLKEAIVRKRIHPSEEIGKKSVADSHKQVSCDVVEENDNEFWL